MNVITRAAWILCFAIISSLSYAQNTFTITGNIKSIADSSPMIGATVKVKEIPTLGTVSDADGNYSLSLEEGSYTIIFSFVGFTDNTQTITGKAGDNLVLDVDLEEDKELLDELVIIGYGESKKEDIAGAIVAVSSEEFNKGIITSPQQLLQGKVSGVQISANNGEPGVRYEPKNQRVKLA